MEMLLIHVFGAFLLTGVAGSRFRIAKLEMCDPNYDYPIIFRPTFRMQGDVEYMNLSAIVKEPFGQNQRVDLVTFFSRTGEKFIKILKVSRPVCDFVNKDLGQFWYEIQRRAAIPVKSCPVRIGRYNLKDYPLPFNKINIPPAFPTGQLKMIITFTELGTNRNMTCINVLCISEQV